MRCDQVNQEEVVPQFYTRDGGLVYEVGYYIIDDQHTDIWHVKLSDEQAGLIKGVLEQLEERDLIGWWKCEVMTVNVDELGELGDRLRGLMPRRPSAKRQVVDATGDGPAEGEESPAVSGDGSHRRGRGRTHA